MREVTPTKRCAESKKVENSLAEMTQVQKRIELLDGDP